MSLRRNVIISWTVLGVRRNTKPIRSACILELLEWHRISLVLEYQENRVRDRVMGGVLDASRGSHSACGQGWDEMSITLTQIASWIYVIRLCIRLLYTETLKYVLCQLPASNDKHRIESHKIPLLSQSGYNRIEVNLLHPGGGNESRGHLTKTYFVLHKGKVSELQNHCLMQCRWNWSSHGSCRTSRSNSVRQKTMPFGLSESLLSSMAAKSDPWSGL